MTTFSLFHQPSFADKVRDIKDHSLLVALFASMLSFSTRFVANYESAKFNHRRFHELSLKYITLALDSHVNKPPPLCLLQAMTLSAFYQLPRGVFGQAWRFLSSAVHIAYELRLYLVDYAGPDEPPGSGTMSMSWSLSEERRRCWWALWVMDLFASTVQRAPTAIDWNMNETHLPVSDEFWFTNRYQASCILTKQPNERWRRVQDSGNESSFAWLIVICSLMRDAQNLTHGNIQGVFSDLQPRDNVPKLVRHFAHAYKRKISEEDSQRLICLVEAFSYTMEALPDVLRFHGGLLTFGTDKDDEEEAVLVRRSCSAIYNIWMVAEFTRFMIYHHYVFMNILSGEILSSLTQASFWNETSTVENGLQSCLEAGDNVYNLLTNCAENHVKFVNPFLANTIWLATALQAFRKIFVSDSTPVFTETKYERLRSTYIQFARFWGGPPHLLRDLDSLETRLELRQRELHQCELSWRTAHKSQQNLSRKQKEQGSLVSAVAERQSGSHIQQQSNLGALSVEPPVGLGTMFSIQELSSASDVGLFNLANNLPRMTGLGEELAPSGSNVHDPGEDPASTIQDDTLLQDALWYSADMIGELLPW